MNKENGVIRGVKENGESQPNVYKKQTKNKRRLEQEAEELRGNMVRG